MWTEARAPRPSRQLASATRAAVLALVLGSLGVFVGLAERLEQGRSFGWDDELLRFFGRHYDSSRAVFVAKAYVEGGMLLGGLLAAAVLGYLVLRGRRREGAFWALSIAGTVAVTAMLKPIVARPSLGGHSGFSYPSGNAAATLAALLAALILLEEARRRAVLALAGAAAVVAYGAALVFLYWHYPSDVVGGWCLACAWVLGLWLSAPRVFGLAAPGDR